MTRVAYDSETLPRAFPKEQPTWDVPEADWAERAVCGAVLAMPERYAEVKDLLRVAHFHDVVCQAVWRAIQAVDVRGERPDYLTVKAEMVKLREYHEAQWAGPYAFLVDAIPRGMDLLGRAQQVLGAYRRRVLQTTFWELCQLATTSDETPDDIIAAAERALKVAAVGSPSTLKTGESLTADALAQIQRALEGGERGLQTGFVSFDLLTGGLEPGQLVILAGRPGTGKTSLAGCMAWHVACCGKVVLFVSLEMGLRELVVRFACLHTGLSFADAKAYLPLSGRERQQHMAALGTVENSGIAIAEDARTVGAVRQHARSLRAQVGRLDLVVVDYLQLMRSDAVKRGDNRVYEIGDISIELKALARELQVPVIALAQLNRNIEHRADRKPHLSDLRDSGQIEQDADLVAFTHHSDGSPDTLVELIVRKHRNGPTADIALRWEKECMRFSDWS
jgi:replicative DNA helicase